MTRRPRITRLARDTRGATLVEFAFVAPVLVLFMMGAFDVGHTLYMESSIEGIVQKTGRDSSLETGTDATKQAATDEKVRVQVLALANNATLAYSRRFYRTFSQALAARYETFSDTDGDRTCDHGEPYTDANNNGVWDADGGDQGQGGAKDKTVYTVTVTYPRMFPINNFVPGLSRNQVLTASTVLQNQPYSDQASYTNTTTVRNCL